MAPPFAGLGPVAGGGRARAVAELRRGLPVVLADGTVAAIVAAAEAAEPEAAERLHALMGTPARLVLTARRARALHLRETGEEAVAVALPERLDPTLIHALADPTRDLENPLRGPFAVVSDVPQTLAAGAVQLCKAARLLPAALVAVFAAPAAPTAAAWARESGLIAVSLAALVAPSSAALRPVADAHVPLSGAEDARIFAFRPPDGGIEHLAIVIGDPPRGEPVLVRIHSECFTGDLLGSLRCDCGQQLRGAVEALARAGGGVLLYLAQEGRGIGLINKLRAYHLQDQGFDTYEANERLGFEADERLFEPAANMLRSLGFGRVRLLTNNPDKVSALDRLGIAVVERVAHAFPATAHNVRYLETKARRQDHKE